MERKRNKWGKVVRGCLERGLKKGEAVDPNLAGEIMKNLWKSRWGGREVEQIWGLKRRLCLTEDCLEVGMLKTSLHLWGPD